MPHEEVSRRARSARYGVHYARVAVWLALPALAGLIACKESAAFDYAEHYAITIQSFRQACEELRKEGKAVNDVAAQLCESNSVANCMAHMTAIAGDYAKVPADFQDAKQQNLLNRNGTNCRDIEQLLRSEVTRSNAAAATAERHALPDFAAHLRCMASADSETTGDRKHHYDPVLIDGWLDRKWRWIKLAANNSEHFQPQSHGVSKTYRSGVTGAGEPDLSATLARHAFSMHFLEDSFAAGHIGLNRSERKFGSWGSRQDYGHAYHDDLNSSGQYVQNGRGETWYSYGDKNLCTPILYVDVAEWMVDIDYEAKQRAMATVILAAYRHMTAEMDTVGMQEKGQEFARRLVPVIDSFSRSAAENGSVASVPVRYPIWAFCSFFVYCNKLELVLVNSKHGPPAEQRFETCDLVLAPSRDNARIAVRACLDTRRHVMATAVLTQRAFLLRLSNTHTSGEVDFDVIDKSFPNSYAPLDFSESQRELSSHPLVLSSKPFQSVDRFEPYRNSAWGFDLAHEDAANDKLRDWSLDFGLQSRLGPSPVSVRGALLTRHDEHWSLIDQIEAGYDFARLTEQKFRVLSIAPFVHAGFDSIFRGEDARNVYGGVGFGIEADIGRYVLHLKVARELHWNDHMGSQWGSRITIGLKIPSLDLAP